MAVDDATYSFRALGYIDYIAAVNRQSTPITWFDQPQWWQNLSFHDAPPLVFAFQWVFFQIFGDNLFAARLPFVLAGLIPIYFLFLIGKKIGGELLGLFSAGAFSIMNYAIWFSRIGWLDGFVALWATLSIYFFLEAKEKPNHYLWWGVSFGAGVLTKYTFLFLGPVFLIALLVWRRDDFPKNFFYFGIAAILILISPVIIYNAMMFQARGHFDAALSTLIGQSPEDFRGLERKAETNFDVLGSVSRIFARNFSYGLWILAAVGLFAAIWNLKEKARRHPMILILLGAIWALIMLSVVGAEDRFGAALLPFVAIVAGIGILWLWQHLSGSRRIIAIILIAMIGIWEFLFMAQTQWLAKPIFDSRFFIASNRPIFAGYNKLEDYVNDFYKTFSGKPNIITYVQAPQLAEYQRRRILDIDRHYPKKPLQDQLLIFDDRMRWFSSLWIFERRRLYDAAPIHSLTEFLEKLKVEGASFYTNLGLKTATIITAANGILLNEYAIPTSDVLADFINQLESQTNPIEQILDHNGEVIFKVFRLPLI